MELDEAELLCYLAAHANGEANGCDPLTCDRMGAALWNDVQGYMFGNAQKVEREDAIQLISEAIVRKTQPPQNSYPAQMMAMTCLPSAKPPQGFGMTGVSGQVPQPQVQRYDSTDWVRTFLIREAERMYEGLMPTRSAKVLIMHTALLKRLGKLKEET